jgi:DNA-binding Xre family transcriptional regulator
VIRFRIDDLLQARGWTRYRLAKEIRMTEPAVYRLSAPGHVVRRIDAHTLEKLCVAFGVQPGALLEHVPTSPRKRRSVRRSRMPHM